MSARRRGRKIGTFNVTAGDGSSTLLASVDYYLDGNDGWFYATWKAEDFAAATRDELEGALRTFFRERHKVEYDPFIEVEMPEAFADETVVVGVKFGLLFVSRQQVSSDGKSKHWLVKRGYMEDGAPRQSVEYPKTRDRLDKFIAFTPERWAKLEQIEKAIAETHARLKSILVDAIVLDSLGPSDFLALPAKKGPREK